MSDRLVPQKAEREALEGVVLAARRFLRQTVKGAFGYPAEKMIELDEALLALDQTREPVE